jgi:hypothetical protein
MKLTLTVLTTKDNDLDDMFFEVTLIVDKDNNINIVDNATTDYKDFVDCNTLTIKENVRISI